MRKLFVGLLVVILTAASPLSHAQRKSCTAREEHRALDEAITLRSWDALYKSYRLYRQCDDGAIAEGYSESGVRILTDHWVTLPRLVSLSNGDAHFRTFVLRHIDATVTPKDLKKIRANAIHHCKSADYDLCKQLRTAADNVLKDNGEVVKN